MGRSNLKKSLFDLFLIFFTLFVTTFLLWLPFILRINFWGLNFSEGFNTIFRNFDGIEYIIIAKSYYSREIIAQLPQFLPFEYYASRFPLFPLLISLFAPLLGYLKSMLFVTLLFTYLSAIMFYFLLRKLKINNPLFLSIIFLFLPARWLIVHSVGSAEPVFIFFILSSIYFFLEFEKEKKPSFILLSALFGFFAQLTKSPGILLFFAYGLYILINFLKGSLPFKKIFSYLPILFIPLGLVFIFYLYSLPSTFADFFAYFRSGDNIHLIFPPFQVFNSNQPWVGDIWLEDIVYILMFSFLAGLALLKREEKVLGYFVLIYSLATSLVAHRDISRYIMPVFPFVLIAGEKILNSKEFKILFPLLLLAIYLYSQNFMIANVAPFPNLELFD